MRIAALYDIHGNLPALEAVLHDVAAEDVDLLVVGGDVVPGPMPSRCLEALRHFSRPARFIQGNGEVDVLAFREGHAPTRVPEMFHDGMRWVADLVDDETAASMAGWPMTAILEHQEHGTVLFCHATPRDENEIFTRITPEERLRPVFEPTGADVVVCGHTHMAFDRRVGGIRVVNAGSVGMPFGSTGAHWALIDGEGVVLRRTQYDLDEATARFGATGYPDVAMLRLTDPPAEETMLETFEAAALAAGPGD